MSSERHDEHYNRDHWKRRNVNHNHHDENESRYYNVNRGGHGHDHSHYGGGGGWGWKKPGVVGPVFTYVKTDYHGKIIL